MGGGAIMKNDSVQFAFIIKTVTLHDNRGEIGNSHALRSLDEIHFVSYGEGLGGGGDNEILS